jgi:hypothetical protein
MVVGTDKRVTIHEFIHGSTDSIFLDENQNMMFGVARTRVKNKVVDGKDIFFLE